MENLPLYVSIVFILTTAFTIGLLYKTTQSKKLLAIVFVWLTVTAIAAVLDFFLVTDTTPPRFLFLVGPPMIAIIAMFSTRQGRTFLNRVDPGILTFLHIVRIPVELRLLWSSVYKLVPELMSFEGRNFDILSGITAPVVYYFAFIKKRLHTSILVGWHLLCLALLFNIVAIAVLSAPTPFQQLAFDQPNVGVLYFPFVWLPSFIVPVVLFSHLVALRRIWLDRKAAAGTVGLMKPIAG